MPTDFSQIAPLLTAVLVVFFVYRRIRRSIGRQMLSRARLVLRAVVLGLIGALLLPAMGRGWQQFAAASAGLLSGAGLAWWGASQTRFARQNGALYYVPHTLTGVIVALLFIGRLAYRFVQHYAAVHSGVANDDYNLYSAAMMRTPLTLGIFYLLVGYYVCYYSWLLYKSRRLNSADLEPAGATAVVLTERDPPPASN